MNSKTFIALADYEVIKNRFFANKKLSALIEERVKGLRVNASKGIRLGVTRLANGNTKITLAIRTELKDQSRLLEAEKNLRAILDGIQLVEVKDII
jgi:hypothetical protein